ncbi:transposase [Gottfriedia sp. NPDC057991]|uniref:transposase n=1 Tax=Gottfriedia sp. NPDC057991 TaxID=3346298 RepID=UPI0036D769C7
MYIVLNTVKAATKNTDVNGILLHSDQGHQYTSRAYNTFLRSKNTQPNISRKGNCLDNACIENFFGHLKSELMYLNNFITKKEVIQAVNEYMYFYNNERFQAKLENRSPIEYRTTVCA